MNDNQLLQASITGEAVNISIPLDNKQLGALLKRIRLLAEKTLTDIENATGISYQQVKKYEDNKSRISITNYAKILQALGYESQIQITKKETIGE